MPTPTQRRANNALGVGILALIALLETVFAERNFPSPASPYVWGVLGTTAVVALVVWRRLRVRAASQPEDTRAP